MTYKYELHCHTKGVSDCGRVTPQEIAQLYYEKGYDGIVVTDHYSPLTFYKKNLFNPQKYADYYLAGYRKMKEYAGDKITILLGMELRHYLTANDYLIYGVDEDFIYNGGNLMTLWERSAYKYAKENGCLMFQAHPFRVGIRRCNPDYIDGVEVYNGKTDRERNEQALKWAQENGKLMCSGSDFHTLEHLARGGIITDRKITSNADLLEVLKSQEFERIETYK